MRERESERESEQIGSKMKCSNRKRGRCEWGRHIWSCLYSNKLNWVQTRSQLLEIHQSIWYESCMPSNDYSKNEQKTGRKKTKNKKFNGLEHTVIRLRTKHLCDLTLDKYWLMFNFSYAMTPSTHTETRWQCFCSCFGTWVHINGRKMKALIVLVSVCDLWIAPKWDFLERNGYNTPHIRFSTFDEQVHKFVDFTY